MNSKKMNSKKIIIAAPIGVNSKMYSLQLWYSWIRTHYPTIKVVLVLNGVTSKDVVETHLRLKEFFIEEINKGLIEMYMIDRNEYKSVKEKISESREAAQHIAKIQEMDYIFWLDTDTIPKIRDPIERLMQWDKPVVTGLYFYKKSNVPVVMNLKGVNISFAEMKQAVTANSLVEVAGFGFGCVLQRKDTFNVKFGWDSFTGEDIKWCENAKVAEFKLYLDPLVVCDHVTEEDVKKLMN